MRRLILPLAPRIPADAAELALRSLIAAGKLEPVVWAERQVQEGRMLRVGSLLGPLSSAAALLWRVVCEELYGEAVSKGLAAAATSGANAGMEAAAAAKRHEVRWRWYPGCCTFGHCIAFTFK